MTIKEIEMLTGMDRGNIRFYEREGLITPKRMTNGYREYTEDDLQVLLRIKLLRSLHISLDEIRGLKDGYKDLADTLSKQIAKLGQEKQDASYAQEVCRAMQKDRVAFDYLDAKKYLDGINQSMNETGSSYFSVKGDELPQVFNPWRRFFARTFDIFMYSVLWSAFIALVFNVNLTARSNVGNIFDTFIAISMMLFFEPFLLHFVGTTPGKLIFGLRIETPDGRRLSYIEGFERTWGVIGKGIGYNIPIYNLIRLWKSYSLCSNYEMLPWDESISYTLKDRKWYRGVLYIVAYGVTFAFLFTVMSSQQLPPNRGDMTVAEFVENHNYYAKFFDIDFGNKYLNSNGKWATKEYDNSVYIDLGYTKRPDFHFTIENGYVTGVSFSIEIINKENWVNSYNTQMTLTSLAFAGAQDEMRLFSKVLSRIAEEIENNTFKDFNFSEAGITFNCDIEYSGYSNVQSHILFPAKDAEETYFKLNFYMSKEK